MLKTVPTKHQMQIYMLILRQNVKKSRSQNYQMFKIDNISFLKLKPNRR